MQNVKALDIALKNNDIRISYSIDKSDFKELHSHDGFCEIYFIIKGEVDHVVNGEMQHIKAPCLVYARENDIHKMQKSPGKTCCFYLVIISKQLLNKLTGFLNNSNGIKQLENYYISPLVPVFAKQYNRIMELLNNLYDNASKDMVYLEITRKILVLELFSCIIMNKNASLKENQYIPQWFTDLCKAAEQKRIFTAGVPALVCTSGKSNQYLCKCFQKYTSMTPSEFINIIRLRYSRKLLADTDMSILDISMECGFSSLSHFYHLFNRQYNTTPAKYRKTTKITYS